jgi:hypothetical protein
MLLLAFRNSGKSSLLALFCAWLLYRYPQLTILVVSANLHLAKKLVGNAKAIIQLHPITFSLKLNHPNTWASEAFTINRAIISRDPSMLGRGIQSNITGLRANIIICDDVEVPNNCDSAKKRQQLRNRLIELEYILTPGGSYLIAGTPHSYYSIYTEHIRQEKQDRQPFYKDFCRLEIPIIDEQGRSQWPERFTNGHIERIRLRSGPNKFESQMMLCPLDIHESRLRPERLKMYDMEIEYSEANLGARLLLGERRLVSASCWWDPSYGSPNIGDASVVAVVYTDEDGSYWLHQIEYLTHDPNVNEYIDEATQMCQRVVEFVKRLYLPSICLETTGLGRFLPNLLRRELANQHVYCSVIEKTSSISKTNRIIEAFDAILAGNRLHAHRNVWKTPFIEEMREWRPGNRCRDDGLDAVAGCLLSEPVRIPCYPQVIHLDRREKRAWRVGSNCIVAKEEGFIY